MDTERVDNWACAVPLLHRLTIDTEAYTQQPPSVVKYSSSFPYPERVVDLVFNKDIKRVFQHQNCSSINPAIPHGSLQSNKHQISLYEPLTGYIRTVNTFTLEPVEVIDMAKRLNISGKLVHEPVWIGEKIIFLFCLNDSEKYTVIEYGPPPDPPSSVFAKFKMEGECVLVAMIDPDTLVSCFKHESVLLYALVKRSNGLAVVYQSEPHLYVRLISCEWKGNDVVMNCVVSDQHDSYSHLQVHKQTEPLDFKACVITLRNVNLEMARFDGAAGQVDRFPFVVTRHVPSHDSSFDPQACMAGSRYLYGRVVEGSGINKYTSISKVDLIGLQKDSFPLSSNQQVSPLIVVKQNTVSKLVATPQSTPEKIGRKFVQAETDENAVIVCLSRIEEEKVSRSSVLFINPIDMEEMARIDLPMDVYPESQCVPFWLPFFQ